MKAILTPEEKKYLRQTCRYIASMGMSNAIVEFDMDNGFDSDSINWNYITHFSNNYSVEIPKGLLPIFKKICDYIDRKNLVDSPDVHEINYEKLEIEIAVKEQEISALHYWSYYTEGDTSGTEWSLEEDPDDQMLKEIFESLKEYSGTLELRYNGSGDSGYIESNFENNQSVPSDVEDWCYGRLESLHGGWEINEGSQGYFIFNLENKTIEIVHTYNTEENDVDTVFEESFSK